jgi:S1-C subfamily serine protease
MINSARSRWSFFIITIVALSLSGCSRATPTAASLDGPTVIADGPAPALGIVIDKHNVVLHVEPNSMAAQAQLQPGDQILSVNGLALIDDRQEVKAAIAQATSTSPLALRISRNGNELNLSAIPASSSAPIPAQPIATTTPVMPPDDYL